MPTVPPSGSPARAEPSAGPATDTDPAATSGPAPTDRRRLLATVAVLLVLAWAVPAGLLAVGVGWLLPLLLWAGMASLLRAGRNILDRFVLALGVLAGLTCAVGLLLSVWPETLRPVPSFGIAFTGLIAFALVARRRPRLSVREFGIIDGGVVLATLATAAFTLRPFLGRGFGDRLSVLAIGGDLARHFTIYDGIRVVGGYLFMHRDEALKIVDDGYESYPQGVHFIYALLADIMPQGTDRNDTVASFDLMITFDIATFVFLCLATLWAVRWVAGPLMKGAIALPLLAAIAGYLVFGDPITMLTRGFPSEMAGGGLLVMLVAIVLRPVQRQSDQVLLVGTLLIGVSFTYFLFLPLAFLAAAVWAYRARKRLLRHWIAVGLSAVAVLAISMVSPIVNTLLSPAGVTARLLLPGGITKVDRPVVACWLLVAIAGTLIGWKRRSPVWRAALTVIVLSTVPAVVLFLYQLLEGQAQQTYYLDKLFHQMLLVTMASSGSILLLLLRLAPRAEPGKRHLSQYATAWALALALFFGVSTVEFFSAEGSGRRHFDGRNTLELVGESTVQAIRMFPHADGRITWVQTSSRIDLGNREQAHWATLYTSVLQRNYRESWSVFYWGYPWLGNSEKETAEFLMTSPEPFRILVGDSLSYEFLTRIKAQYPSLDLDIIDLRESS